MCVALLFYTWYTCGLMSCMLFAFAHTYHMHVLIKLWVICTVSKVVAWHTTSNFIITDGLCLLGHRVKKDRIVSRCRFVAKCS